MAQNELSKRYYRIREVAEIIGVNSSTLRFWENEFPEIQPMRSAHNQRFYRREDIETLRLIYYLVKIKGLKIEAAKNELKLNRKNITKRFQIIDKLNDVKDELQAMLDALEKRRD